MKSPASVERLFRVKLFLCLNVFGVRAPFKEVAFLFSLVPQMVPGARGMALHTVKQQFLQHYSSYQDYTDRQAKC